MACLNKNMFNNEQRNLCSSTTGPRISFSNDFADSHQPILINHHQPNYKEEPVSSDFEFSVENGSFGATTTSADDIFFKGVLLPLKDSFIDVKSRKLTLKDELLVDDSDDEPMVMKGYSSRWKARLGLKRKHVVVKKCSKSYGGLESVIEEKSCLALDLDDGLVNKKSQEVLNYGEAICKDLETGI